MKKTILLAGLFAILSLFGGSVDAKPYRITATIGMLGDVVQEVVGDRAEVKTLLRSGIDPHLYKPTRSDVVALEKSDLVFYHGLNLEGKMEEVFAHLQKRGRAIVAVGNGVLTSGNYSVEKDEQHYDPHIWMDVKGWMEAVKIITDSLSDFDPEGKETFEKNAKQYLQKLQELHEYGVKSFASIPEGQRVLITAHDAFQYLGRAYGVEVQGIQGISTESEAGLQDVEKKVAFVVERKIPAIFVETSVSDKNVRALIEGAAAKGHTLVIGGELFSDAMGAVGTYEGTYLGMLDHNITTIVRALGGDAPAQGLWGKLKKAEE